jgi:hypothetical protein
MIYVGEHVVFERIGMMSGATLFIHVHVTLGDQTLEKTSRQFLRTTGIRIRNTGESRRNHQDTKRNHIWPSIATPESHGITLEPGCRTTQVRCAGYLHYS